MDDGASLFSDSSYTLRGAEVFTTGRHRGKAYTARDLADMERNFHDFSSGDRPVLRVPAVLGHEETQEFLERTDLPAAAWAENGYRHGKLFKVDFADLAPKVARLLKGKAYRTVSAEVYDFPPEGVPGDRSVILHALARRGRNPEQDLAEAERWAKEEMPRRQKAYDAGELKRAPEFDSVVDERLRSHLGKMLRRVAFLGGEIPQIKSLADIPEPELHSEWPRPGSVQLQLNRIKLRRDGAGWMCFSEVFHEGNMDRDEMIKALGELGYDISLFTSAVPDELLAEMLRVDDSREEEEEEDEETPAEESPAEEPPAGEPPTEEHADDMTGSGEPNPAPGDYAEGGGGGAPPASGLVDQPASGEQAGLFDEEPPVDDQQQQQLGEEFAEMDDEGRKDLDSFLERYSNLPPEQIRAMWAKVDATGSRKKKGKGYSSGKFKKRSAHMRDIGAKHFAEDGEPVDEDQAKMAERARRFAERAISMCSRFGGVDEDTMKKLSEAADAVKPAIKPAAAIKPPAANSFSEQQLEQVVRRVLKDQVGESISALRKFSEQETAARKKSAVKEFVESRVQAGKIIPVEAEMVTRRLLRADSLATVETFSEKGGKKVSLTELDLQMREIDHRPAFRFGGKVKSQGNVTNFSEARDVDVTAELERYYEEHNEVYVSNTSKEDFVKIWKKAPAEERAKLLGK